MYIRIDVILKKESELRLIQKLSMPDHCLSFRILQINLLFICEKLEVEKVVLDKSCP